MHCAVCNDKQCYRKGKNCSGMRDEISGYYRNEWNRKSMAASAKVEAKGYANSRVPSAEC